MARTKAPPPDKAAAMDAINDLIAHAQGEPDPGMAKPHVGKQDVMEALGKKRLGAPRAIKSKDGKTVADVIYIKAPKLEKARAIIYGETPLITNCWSWKVIQKMIRDHMQLVNPASNKVQKKGQKKVRDAKNPFEIFLNSLYEHRDGGYGFPCNGIKKAIVSACSFSDGISPRFVGGAVRINGELAQILGTPKCRFDMVTVKDNYGNRKPDTRFRGQFDEWAAIIDITYASSIIDLPNIVNLLTWAGQAVGIGEWRPEKDGNNGSFHVASEAEGKDILKRLKPANRRSVTEANSGVNEILEKFRVFDWSDDDGTEEAA